MPSYAQISALPSQRLPAVFHTGARDSPTSGGLTTTPSPSPTSFSSYRRRNNLPGKLKCKLWAQGIKADSRKADTALCVEKKNNFSVPEGKEGEVRSLGARWWRTWGMPLWDFSLQVNSLVSSLMRVGFCWGSALRFGKQMQPAEKRTSVNVWDWESGEIMETHHSFTGLEALVFEPITLQSLSQVRKLPKAFHWILI